MTKQEKDLKSFVNITGIKANFFGTDTVLALGNKYIIVKVSCSHRSPAAVLKAMLDDMKVVYFTTNLNELAQLFDVDVFTAERIQEQVKINTVNLYDFLGEELFQVLISIV